METGLVGGKPGPLDLHPTKRAHRDTAVGLAAPGTAPVLQLDELGRSFFHEELNCILVSHPVGTGDSVVDVLFEAVVLLNDRSRTTLGGHGVAPHRVDLGHDRDVELWVRFCCSDGRAEPCPSASYDKYVMHKRSASS